MSGITLNKKTFKRIIIGLAVAAFLLIALILIIQFNIPGLIGGFFSSPEDDDKTQTVDETGPWGNKYYTWEYQGESFDAQITVSKETYKNQNGPFGGTDMPANLLNYCVLYDNDDAVCGLADQLEMYAEQYRFNTEETLDFVLSFVKSIPYETDAITGHHQAYPRSPVVTLADETGDSEDHTILAYVLLEAIGYASAVWYYPPVFDRNTIIPGACALGVVGYSNQAPWYDVNTTYAADEVSFMIYSRNGGVSGIVAPSGSITTPGWYSGNGTWRTGNLSGNLTGIICSPKDSRFTAELINADGRYGIPDDVRDITVTISNPVWTTPVKVIWLVNTSEKGISAAAYNKETPVIIQDDILWSGIDTVSESKETLDLGLAFDLEYHTEISDVYSTLADAGWISSDPGLSRPIHYPLYLSDTDLSGNLAQYNEVWHDEMDAYYTDTWQSSGVSWTYTNDKWKLYEQFLTIPDIPAELYRPDGTLEYASQMPWRLTYSIINIDNIDTLNPEGDWMTPYAGLYIAVYSIGSDGKLTLEEITGWQGNRKANPDGVSKTYNPGKYAIGVFSRNVDAAVTVQYYGKKSIVPYTGDI